MTTRHLKSDWKSISEVARWRAKNTPNSTAFIFLENGEVERAKLTFAELDERARQIAAALQKVACAGQRVMLLYPAGLEFIAGFMGCLYAGVIAVPAYLPRPNRSLRRLRAIVEDADVVCALTTGTTLAGLENRVSDCGELGKLRFLPTDSDLPARAEDWQETHTRSTSLAMLQYTSGSTGDPKGVMVNHANILSNMAAIRAAGSLGEEARILSWLPMFHDMGLFGYVLQPLYVGALSVLMEPAAFVQRPVRWLRAITKYQATHSGGPNSAFDLCVQKIDDAAKSELDLRSWQTAFNGAEPVRASTIERFCAAFASCGFQRHAIYPCYGLAEATLFAAGAAPGSLPAIKQFDAVQLARGSAVAADQHSRPHFLVSCGRASAGHEVRIVDPKTCEPSDDGKIGEIWLSGPSIAGGYWNRPEQSEHTFRARLATDEGSYLRTGDLGFVYDGDLFITGRLKDIIIVHGRNHYPQDLERTVERSHSSLMPNGCCAFSVEIGNEEPVVVACELMRGSLRNPDAAGIAAKIRQALAEEHDIDLHALLLLKTATIPRTSSGKIRRHQCRAAFQSGEGLAIVAEWRKPDAATRPSCGAGDIAKWLRARIGEIAGIAAERVDTRAPFSAYGLSSADAIAISGELQDWLGRSLAPTVAYDFPNIDRLARHLAGVDEASGRSAAPIYGSDCAMAVIGMACRLPGAANPEEFWDLLRHGRDAMVSCGHRSIGAEKAGLLNDIAEFDAEFFGISAREAETMDPQQRLLLEVVWEALEDAGVPPGDLAGGKIAVVIGISNADYARLQSTDPSGTEPYVATGNALSVAANRISYLHDFRGPSWAVDTACSSSLVAVHQACGLLRRGEADMAIAGGVNLLLGKQLTMAFARSGMLSPDGVCRTFDAAANGYVRGEGAGIVVLKRLRNAQDDEDRILAVIRGSAVNQDGRSNGLTAPNGPAQQAAIRDALRDAGREARDVGYVEAHGTGTPLGDPIEFNSLMAVLGQGRPVDGLCWVGSVKTNIGHLEAAAGIAGLIKAVMIVNRGEIPSHLHCRRLNPHISLDNTPFRIPVSLTRWNGDGKPRLAGVSSFGFGGTNVHVILEEAPPSREPPPQDGETTAVMMVSARTPVALAALAENYAAYLERHPEISLLDAVFTANTGRTRFSYSASIEASTVPELCAKLRALGSGDQLQCREATSHSTVRGRRVSLPTYPFQRRRYWLQCSKGAHPLLGERLMEHAELPGTHSWEAQFDGEVGAFLNGHRVMDTLVVPWPVYAEMALSAAAQAYGKGFRHIADLALHQPLFIQGSGPRTVQTVLTTRPDGEISCRIYSRAGTGKWLLCASAVVCATGEDAFDEIRSDVLCQ